VLGSRRRLALFVAVAVAAAVPATFGTAGPAQGEPEGGGGFRPCTPSTCVWAAAHEVPAGPVRDPSQGRATLRVVRTYEDCGPNFEVALVLAIEDIATGLRFELSRTCPAPVQTTPDPTVPPTADEVWRELPLWTPTASLTPACRGVVGWPTRVWATPSPPVAVDVTLAGRTWSVVAEPVGWRVEAADAAAVAGAAPGSADEPLGQLLFADRGRRVVRVTETWTGSYTGPLGSFTLDYVDVTAVVTTYRVVEVQAVVVGPGAHVDDPSAGLACGE
jgi:hypothetical protein